MKTLHFTIQINAPRDKVYNIMLGLENKTAYESWVSVFNPTSTYEGNWDKGSKIRFIGTDEKGNKGGMLSEIAENIPNKFVSIRHYGIIKNEKEITSGEEVDGWSGTLENYSFEKLDKNTLITVSIDIAESHSDYFEQTYPKALRKLKNILEDAQHSS